jgi:MFS family permease
VADLITQYTRKPARFGRLDGTEDLDMGGFFLTFALWLRLSEGATVLWRWVAMSCAIFVVAALVGSFCTRYIRRRLVYPRSGYLEFRKRPWAMALLAVLAMVIAAAVFWFLVQAHSSRLSYPLMGGLVIGLVMLIRALLTGMPRMAVLGALSMAIGLALQFLEPTMLAGGVWYCLTMGTACLLSGALTLCLFVRRMPPRDLEAE